MTRSPLSAAGPSQGAKSAPSGGSEAAEAASVGAHKLRLDKWLWAARFYKTRTLSSQAIEAGQVRLGDERVKPAHSVHVGETVSVRKAGYVWVVTVLALSDRRGGAADAALLYRESDASIAAREELVRQKRAAEAAAPGYTGRPTKRQRRKLEDFLNEP